MKTALIVGAVVVAGLLVARALKRAGDQAARDIRKERRDTLSDIERRAAAGLGRFVRGAQDLIGR